MIYLDANIFIYATINNNKEGEICRDILSRVAFKKMIANTSFLTWDELSYVIRREKDREKAIEEGKEFLKFPSLIFLKVDKSIIDKAQELIEHYNIKPRDAIHAASAIVNGIKEIISDDSDFDKVKEIKRTKLEEVNRTNCKVNLLT